MVRNTYQIKYKAMAFWPGPGPVHTQAGPQATMRPPSWPGLFLARPGWPAGLRPGRNNTSCC